MSRVQLTTPTTFYVSPSGVDTNDGLTPQTAMATRQAAWNNLMANYDWGIQPITIQLADGTYSDDFSASGAMPFSGPVSLIGNVATPDNCVINANGLAFGADSFAKFYVSGFKITALGANGNGLVAGHFGMLLFGAMDFGQCNGEHIAAWMNGEITGDGTDYMISGGASDHWKIDSWGTILINPCNVGIRNPLAFNYFHRNGAGQGCFKQVNFWGNGVAGTTGTKFGVNENATTLINGVPPNVFFPGNVYGNCASDSLLE